MLLQLLADAEGVVQFLHEVSLVGSQGIGIGRIHCGEQTALHLVVFAIDGTDTLLVVHMVEETTILHLPLRATLEDGCLLLELDDGNGLMHLGCQLSVFLVDGIAWQDIGQEFLAGIVAIDLEGKGG